MSKSLKIINERLVLLHPVRFREPRNSLSLQNQAKISINSSKKTVSQLYPSTLSQIVLMNSHLSPLSIQPSKSSLDN